MLKSVWSVFSNFHDSLSNVNCFFHLRSEARASHAPSSVGGAAASTSKLRSWTRLSRVRYSGMAPWSSSWCCSMAAILRPTATLDPVVSDSRPSRSRADRHDAPRRRSMDCSSLSMRVSIRCRPSRPFVAPPESADLTDPSEYADLTLSAFSRLSEKRKLRLFGGGSSAAGGAPAAEARPAARRRRSAAASSKSSSASTSDPSSSSSWKNTDGGRWSGAGGPPSNALYDWYARSSTRSKYTPMPIAMRHSPVSTASVERMSSFCRMRSGSSGSANADLT